MPQHPASGLQLRRLIRFLNGASLCEKYTLCPWLVNIVGFITKF